MKTPIVTRYNNDWKSREEYEENKRLKKLKETVKEKTNDRN